MTIKIDITGYKMDGLEGKIRKWAEAGTQLSVRHFESLLVKYTPARKGRGGGGQLRASLHFRKQGRLQFKSTPKYYFAYLDKGTGVYGRGSPIVPVRKKALAWHPQNPLRACGRGTGCIVRKSVRGIRPFRIVDKATRGLQRDIERIYEMVAEKIIGG